MNIDFPLILVILVFGSGFIWLLDVLVAARPRRARIAALQAQFPRWDVSGSVDAKRFAESVSQTAEEPAIVEYARSFSLFWRRSLFCDPFFSSPFKYRLHQWCPLWKLATIF